MFTEADRSRLLEELIDQARADPAVVAAALVGSASRGTSDRWSDIDLALGLTDAADVVDVADRWTSEVGDTVTVADTLDVWAGPVLYRVFLLHDSLQVDVSFWPAGILAPTGAEPLTTIFGEVAAPTSTGASDRHTILGWGWLYALHARSAIARGRRWQALQMLQGLRDQAIILSCLRHGLPTHHGRGVDQLPASVLNVLAGTLPAVLSPDALAAAYATALKLLTDEAEQLDPVLAARLHSPLATLRATATATVS